jgi:microsomal dipeptidase-like Zn-dependent dipeptidase
MNIDRRTMLAGTAALLASGPAAARKPAAAPAGWYDRAVIIDALGGLGDPYGPDDQLRMSDRGWSEMVATGVTLLRDTVFPVGNVVDPWGDYQKDVEGKHNVLTADSHPKGEDLLRHVEHVANVAGEDHVGIGTDNGVLPQATDAEATRKLHEWAAARIKAGIAAPGEGLDVWPMVKDYNSIDRYRRFAADLAKRGWSEARLEKLMGANFLRVYKDAWGG